VGIVSLNIIKMCCSQRFGTERKTGVWKRRDFIEKYIDTRVTEKA
jgi:hypothetical protein